MRDCGKNSGRWMGLDVGARSIGVALTDPLRITSRPLTTLRRKGLGQDAQRILELIRQHEVVQLVVGRPCHLDGRPGEVLGQIEPLARRVEQLCGLPLAWAEERLSSKEAERLMAEMGCSVAERRRRRDEFAAALILRWFLDEQCHKEGQSTAAPEQECS